MSDDLSGGAVLFDLDGTLVDTAEDLAAAMNHALSLSGLEPVPSSQVRHLVGHGARRMLVRGFQISANREAGEEELDTALTRFLEYYQENISVHSRPFEGVIDMIDSLYKDGVRFAICTNKKEAMAELLLKKLGVAHLFDVVVGADTATAAKPDPAPVYLCLERTNAKRSVFIGDSDTDIRAAKAAGIACFVARFGYGPVTLAKQANVIFDSYEEAAPLIRDALKV